MLRPLLRYNEACKGSIIRYCSVPLKRMHFMVNNTAHAQSLCVPKESRLKMYSPHENCAETYTVTFSNKSATLLVISSCLVCEATRPYLVGKYVGQKRCPCYVKSPSNVWHLHFMTNGGNFVCFTEIRAFYTSCALWWSDVRIRLYLPIQRACVRDHIHSCFAPGILLGICSSCHLGDNYRQQMVWSE